MYDTEFMKCIDDIRSRDPRYDVEAYCFVRDALDFTVRMCKKPVRGARRHVSAKELMEGIRVFALQEFGPMTLSVLREWGIQGTGDIGDIVFHLVESGKLGKTDEDRKEDFAAGFDFTEAFAKPFQPRAPGGRARGGASGPSGRGARRREGGREKKNEKEMDHG